MNAFWDNLPATAVTTVLLAALAVFAILSDQMWRNLPADQTVVYQPLQSSPTAGKPALAKP